MILMFNCEMVFLPRSSRNLLSTTQPWRHVNPRDQLGTFGSRDFCTRWPNSARPTLSSRPVNHTGDPGSSTPPANHNISLSPPPLALGALPSRISPRAFSTSSATRSTRDTSSAMDDTSSAAPASSSWVGHQGAAAFDLRSEWQLVS